ncbi:MAG TPA: hypothetical protein VH682_25770 [Gemmataceae bacterium]|jgi:hypothetical protein
MVPFIGGRQVVLGKLNSMTKYPSILTYHALGHKGVLQETVQVPFEGRIIGTEKVDGTNTRLIFCPDQSVLVGSREDLLWERRDLIGNPAMGIVEAVKETVHRLVEMLCRSTSSRTASSLMRGCLHCARDRDGGNCGPYR